jgi:putative membrane protein
MSAAHLRNTVLSMALVSMGLAMSATAQTTLDRGDRKFMEDAAQGGMAEVQLGQLAAQKGQSAGVKQFGQRMVDDHTKANTELKQLASNKGVNLPTDLTSSDKREYDKLSKMNGDAFDREYMKDMVSDHKKDVKDFEKQAKSARDADVKSFASNTLPTLQQHLTLAEQTDGTIRAASRESSTTRTSGPAPGQPGSEYGRTGGTGGTTPSSNTTPPKGY